MSQKDEAFRHRLLATFKIEAEEGLKSLSSNLLAVEKASTAEARLAAIETVYRAAHSLKGAARTVNMTAIEALCQALESVFAALKRQTLELSPPLFDTLHHVLDTLGPLLASPAAGEKASVAGLIQQLAALEALAPDGAASASTAWLPDNGLTSSREEAAAPAETEGQGVDARLSPLASDDSLLQGAPPPPEVLVPSPTVRIATAKLDALFLHAQEMLAAKLSVRQRAADLLEMAAMLQHWHKTWDNVFPAFRHLQRGCQSQGGQPEPAQMTGHVAQLLEFLAWHHTHLDVLDRKLKTLSRTLEHDQRTLGGMVDNLLEETKKALMLPASWLLDILPKLVRDLSRAQGKHVELVLQGSEIEIDRRILEEVRDPLIHVLRNCIDHGIETPAARQRYHKPVYGTVTVTISQVSSDRVEVVVGDDGAGIDTAKVKATAIKLGIVSPEQAQALNEREALELIFHSDVSTSPIITDISGRGLGLAIVREKITQLGGCIAVASESHHGTLFRIGLPITLATFRGVLVQAAGQLFVVPTAQVEYVLRLKPETAQTVGNRRTVCLKGRVIPLVRLADVLGLQQSQAAEAGAAVVPVFILSSAEGGVAFSVDAILQEQEVLVKSLGKQLSRVCNIAAATVLGSGQVVPILHATDLLLSAGRTVAVRERAGATEGAPVGRRKSILLAEDSITTRMLLKNILESAGYQVTTAMDGIDAWTALQTDTFDLVVSDVQMPGMSGFDLTTKMRRHAQMAHVPVVLVTTLAAPEDRERGMEVGANAYIVKSDFDQSNLLGVIQRLV